MSSIASLSAAKRKLLESFIRQKIAKPVEAGAIPRRQSTQPAPLALSQEQILIRERNAPEIPLYNESITLKFTRPMDPRMLQWSMVEIVRRHEIWRTNYDTVSGELVQIVNPVPDRFELPFVDLRRSPEWQRKAGVRKLSLAQTARPFDLRKDPLVRATLVAMSDSEYWLVMTAHQSVVDGVSVYQIFPKELFAIYQAFAAGFPCPLPELPLQFADFAFWQREYLSAPEKLKQIAYWRAKLADAIPIRSWPARKSRAAERAFRGYIREFTLARGVADSASALGRSNGVTMFAVLMTTYFTLLRCYSGHDDLVIGTLSPSGRKRSEVQGLLGYFLNPVAIRVDLSDDPSFCELLRRVQMTISEAISNDAVPFEYIVNALNPGPDHGRNPYFDFALSLQPCMPDSGGAWSVTSMDAESGGSALDLYVAFIDRPEGLHARVQYNPDIFEFQEMQRMIHDFQALLALAAAHPQERISQLAPG
ncbi:MAG TPA: condensation domain-containing protein [Candidatus Aquilonibacter sp.]|nr:condensation domain-containing protein [Candidatus Aquilonibacter sp.]